MRNRSKLIFCLAVIITAAFTFGNGPFSYVASATYVEGDITQDTVWTLIDSPFVVSKDVKVYPSATLTIEPDVEVRFGGYFSLVVEGGLSACGEENKTITFTSNKDHPEAGDWNTIEFNGTVPSTLAYCDVQYAKDGITIENGNVMIENCQLANNSESGIHLTGTNQAVIQFNRISSNKNGILLGGDWTTGVSITENIVMSNTQSGIEISVGYYVDVAILNNILSANRYGFQVSGQARTYITRNSISYNYIGIFYTGGENHVANYNDIYGNEYGIDVSSSATVNAEYNYWGHESGPYHVSLSPAGEGNPVGGNGVNLDFIFFLTAPIGYINTPPVARLLKDKTLVGPNQAVTFIATTSSDDGRVDKYLFNFGDGYTSGWTTLSIFVHEYSSVGIYNASLTVMDDFGVTSTNAATSMINVQDLNPPSVSIIPNHYQVSSVEEVSIAVVVTYETSPVENAGITLFAIRGGNLTASSGLTNSTGYFITAFVAPNVTQITNVRITATASKSGYADGSNHVYITVIPPLSVEVTADPFVIESEAKTEVTTHITYIGQPVEGVLVSVWSDGGGSFSATEAVTDANGDATFVFTAPQTTMQLNVTLAATATKAGYFDGLGQTRIAIEPRRLIVELTADPSTVSSEKISHVIAHVTYNMTPVAAVNVTMSSEYGTFSPETGTTNSNGATTFTFTAPQVNTQLNVTITATATTTDFADGESQAEITVNPGTLDVHVAANPTAVESETPATVTVRVTYNANPVEGVLVSVWSDGGGSFSATEAVTDANGDATFVFTAPQTTMQLNVTLAATATKAGYFDGQGYTRITVNPRPGGWMGLPLITMLIIVVVIAVVVIVLALIRLKVIYISRRQK